MRFEPFADGPTKQLIDGVPDAIVLVDGSGAIVLANKQVEALLGYTEEELLGQPIEILVPERLRHRHVDYRGAFSRSPSVRAMGSGLMLTAQRRDGSEVAVEISLGPIATPNGVVTAAAIRDVTERRRQADEIRRTMWYLKSAVESIGDAFLLVDEHDRVVLVNSTARELFDGPLEDGVGERTFAEVLDGSLAAGVFDSPFESRASVRARWLAYHTAPDGLLELRDGGGRTLRIKERRTAEGGLVMLIADVTEDVMREEELHRAREAADAANAAKSEFLASMSHELRTPLNAVIGFTQLLQRDRKEPLSERQQERLAHVRRGGEHLLKLIDEVLDLSRIEAGRVTISPEPVELSDVLAEVRSSLEPVAERAGITLVVEPAELKPVRADRTRLAQILMNFGSNAIKYGREGGTAVFRVQQHGAMVRLTVIDDGIGIPETHRARIFEPFQRAGQEAGPIEGTGIGLTICKRLAELMNGAVGFDSVEGKGSQFWVDVPLFPSATPMPSAAARAAIAESALAGATTRQLVIYIEDNPSNIAFMRELFDELPHLELVTAPTAELGIELVRARKPALVLMDINLPGMSGIEATRRLASWPETSRIPVVALTAAAMTRDTARAASAGFHRYLTKPVMVDELVKVLEELLAPG